MSGTNARGTTQTQRLNAPLGTLDTTTPKPDKSLKGLPQQQLFVQVASYAALNSSDHIRKQSCST